MLKTKWNIKKNKMPNIDLQIDKDVLSILVARGITKKKDIYNFLMADLDDLREPELLFDISKARDRVIKAIKNDEKICIYGDYDVDGITSTSVLYLGLIELGAKNIDYYIPIRDEGYGLNNEALSSIKEEGNTLVITVDCGITSYKEIEYANKIGLDVIITDHHTLLNPVVPNAYAVINPKRLENKYSFNDLAGVGTAFMLLWSIFKVLKTGEEAFKYLDLVAIGSIADVVSLVDQNRIIVKYGLKQLKNTHNLGLKMLCDKVFENKIEYDSTDISFVISPIFNAAGRLKDAKLVVRLLISNNPREVELIIEDLLNKNNQRKVIQNNIFEMAKKELNNSSDFVLISSSPNYHHGVIGIVAAKIVDSFYKPCIILEEKHEENIAVASCRSIANFDITKALQYCQDLLVKFGGHKGAAGFTIELDKIDEFRDRINEYAKQHLKEEDFYKIYDIDKQIPIQKISYEFIKSLDLLKPFGFGNPTPLLLTKSVMVENVKQIGASLNHLNFDISQKGYVNKGAVWFFKGEEYDNITKNLFFDIIFKLAISEYKGKNYTKVYIEDMKISNMGEDKAFYLNSLYDTSFPIKSIFYTNKEIEKNDDIRLELEIDRVLVYRGKEYITKLDNNISNLLIQCNSFYGYNYKAKIQDVKIVEGICNVDFVINREFDFVCYKKNDANLFKRIKTELLQDREYSNLDKKILKELFRENKNVLISSLNIGGDIEFKKEYVLDALETFSIYLYKKHNEKVYINIKDKNILQDKRLKFFTTKEKSRYAILDSLDGIDPKEFEKIILLDDTKEEEKGFVSIHYEYKIPSNVLKLNKENIKKYKMDNIYIKSLPNNEKIKLKEKMFAGEIILANDSINEII